MKIPDFNLVRHFKGIDPIAGRDSESVILAKSATIVFPSMAALSALSGTYVSVVEGVLFPLPWVAFLVCLALGMAFFFQRRRGLRKISQKDRTIANILRRPSQDLLEEVGNPESQLIVGLANRDRIVFANRERQELSILEEGKLTVFNINALQLSQDLQGRGRLTGPGISGAIELPGDGEHLHDVMDTVVRFQGRGESSLKRVLHLDSLETPQITY